MDWPILFKINSIDLSRIFFYLFLYSFLFSFIASSEDTDGQAECIALIESYANQNLSSSQS